MSLDKHPMPLLTTREFRLRGLPGQALPLLPKTGELGRPLRLRGGQGAQPRLGPRDEEPALGVLVAQGLAAQTLPLDEGPALLQRLQPLLQGLATRRKAGLLLPFLQTRPLPLRQELALLPLQPRTLRAQDSPIPEDRPDSGRGLEGLAAQRVLLRGELLLPREERGLVEPLALKPFPLPLSLIP